MAPQVAITQAQIGPHPSFIHVAEQYVFQQQIQNHMVAIGTNPTREDNFRLQGVQWINDVRTALQLPVRTFCTAVFYFHKFRLVHKDNEYHYPDAAAAALLTACKIEDTLKKSREILCAAHNLKVSASEHLSSDDLALEGPSKAVIGLERLMLEASGFDFRVRYPHKHLIKLAREAGLDKDVTRVGYNMMIDIYRTFAPLKQSCSTLSFACLELATKILEKQQESLNGKNAPRYKKWGTRRAEVLETILDLLDLYTHFQKSSIVGPGHSMDKFIQLKIKVNQEAGEGHRYTEFHDAPKTNGFNKNIKTPKTPVTPASPADVRPNGKDGASPATLSPRSSGSGRRGIGARGQDGTVRFMLDAEQAKEEKDITSRYFKEEFEEYEVEVEEPIKPEKKEDRRPQQSYPRNGPNGRDDRPPFHQNKRIRR
ncbi:cyclin-like protein [Acephala macrosclerotiorum]|nr:cyclin-like protein [Acephala macrosclerotiorum]